MTEIEFLHEMVKAAGGNPNMLQNKLKSTYYECLIECMKNGGGGSGGGLPTGGGGVATDWNANEGEAGYIANRTHWTEFVETELMPVTTLTPTPPFSFPALAQRFWFVAGESYKIVYNGAQYNCIAVEAMFMGNPVIVCGNASLADDGLAVTQEPFAVAEFVEEDPMHMGVNAAVFMYDAETCTMSISGVKEVVHKLPQKYLEGGNNNIKNGSGYGTLRSADSAEENDNYKMGYYAFAIGYETQAAGKASHAQGYFAMANGDYSHAEGEYAVAKSPHQHVQGKYNIVDAEGKYAHIVGNGEWANHSNAHTLDWDGNAWYAGTVEGTALILKSSTSGSTKRFKITVDDSGTLSAVAI